MKVNKSEIGIVTALLTFIIVKVTFSRIGIENMPAPIIITLFVVSYIMFITGVNKKKLPQKEKKYFILCASLIAISIIACIFGVILMHYFQQIVIEHGEILLVLVAIEMISFICATLVAITIKKGRG